MRNRKVHRLGQWILYAICFCLSAGVGLWLAGEGSGTKVAADQPALESVWVGGMPIGIYMETRGALILGTEGIANADGQVQEPAKDLVKPGDYLVGINGQQVRHQRDVVNVLKAMEEKEVVLQLQRGREVVSVHFPAIKTGGGAYRLGIWLRDTVQGLGTLTFLSQQNHFGALGHGIHDVDTGTLLRIEKGDLYRVGIRSVCKGAGGNPGSMEGLIVYNGYNHLGTIRQNTELGIYGTVREGASLFFGQSLTPVASVREVKTGQAYVRCFTEGQVKDYEIRILEVNPKLENSNKGIILQVIDPVLLEKTGGIVQGMSGAPILQKGKFVGAITHVFVSDPAKGYGIFAETMVRQGEAPE